MVRRPVAFLPLLAPLLALGACARGLPPPHPVFSRAPLPPLPQPAPAPRTAGFGDGTIGATHPLARAAYSLGTPEVPPAAGTARPARAGRITLDFAATDIRAVAEQILGRLLRVNYTIDPAVHGSATLHTVLPLTRAELLPTLEVLLEENGATLLRQRGLYRIVPAAAAAASAGRTVVPLTYASAVTLAPILAPFVAKGGHIAADPGRNALIVSGDASTRHTLAALVRAFDVDALAGRSFALFPVDGGGARSFARALTSALAAGRGGALAGLVQVAPLPRIGAVLLIARNPAALDAARRVFALVRSRRAARLRVWHIFTLRNGRAGAVSRLLQRAFTPGHVSARRTTTAAPGLPATTLASTAAGQGAAPSAAGTTPGANGADTMSPAGGLPVAATTGASATNPLLGPISATTQAGGGAGGGSGGAGGGHGMRILADRRTNAVLVYATADEQHAVAAMLRRIDTMPLEVRIDATVAEVTLNDALQYGTQFFFKSGGINAVLSAGTSAALQTSFPGFVLSGHGADGAPLAISALQQVTTVKVLSSPELLVANNHTASIQVGNLVPYLTQSAQSTLAAGAPVINSIAYRNTGVIMQVTPRINRDGLVTLQISQQVSGVDPASQVPGISSPTFFERAITSRVIVEDGQTIGLAGLITDSASRGNQGLPFLKDVPVLGALFGSQSNSRQRTELLVLITPHVIHDQRGARALTEDLRQRLRNAALVPASLARLPPTGSDDPNAGLLRRIEPKP